MNKQKIYSSLFVFVVLFSMYMIGYSIGIKQVHNEAKTHGFMYYDRETGDLVWNVCEGEKK